MKTERYLVLAGFISGKNSTRKPKVLFVSNAGLNPVGFKLSGTLRENVDLLINAKNQNPLKKSF